MIKKGEKKEDQVAKPSKKDPSISTKNGLFDYRGCLFEVRLKKKGVFGFNNRHVYFTPTSIVITKEPYQKKPDKIIYIQPDWKVEWIYDPKKIGELFENKVLGFKLLTNDDSKIEYYGEVVILQAVRDYFSKQIFQVKFLDEFEIQKKVGNGKYAKVYKVRRKHTNQFFAAKYLHKNKLATIEDAQVKQDDYFRALFNELKILRLVSHTNCIRLEATYEDENGYYILTELLDSEKSLQGELVKYSNLQLGYKVVRHILKQLIQGIEYVHSLGIMHRDLKPQNIMFAANDGSPMQHLKIIDFGLAQFTSDPNYIYVHVGTPGYVAPEILANESDKHRYTDKCDLFSIGVVFHILLTGRSVFPGKKFSQVLQSNKECKIDLTGPKYDDLNREAIDLLSKLLDPNPLTRPSAKESLGHQFFLIDFLKPTDNSSSSTTILLNNDKNANKNASSANLDTNPSESPRGLESGNKESIKEIKFKAIQKLTRGYHDLQKPISSKDFDAMQINFEELSLKMKEATGMARAQHNIKPEKKEALYKLALELVDIFIMLDDNRDDDLSFFASPLKPRKNRLTKNGLGLQTSGIEQTVEGGQNEVFQDILTEECHHSFGQKQNNEKKEDYGSSRNYPQPQEIQENFKGEHLNDNNQQFSQQQQEKIEINRQKENQIIQQNPKEGKLLFSSGQKGQDEEEEEKRDVVADLDHQSRGYKYTETNGDGEEVERKQFPKQLMQLLQLFPQEFFDRVMEGDLKKEGKLTVRVLGKFLLLGQLNQQKIFSDAAIQRLLEKVKISALYAEWFIQLVAEMVSPNIDLVPDFLYLQARLRSHLSSQEIPNN